MTPPWMMYLGVMGGYHWFNVQFGSNYFSTIGLVGAIQTGGNMVFNQPGLLTGATGGLQIGIQYHFNSPYFAGLVFDAMLDSDKLNIRQHLENILNPNNQPFDLLYEFQVNYNLDIAAIIGADLTQKLHGYFKLGATYALLSNQLTVLQTTNNGPSTAPRLPPSIRPLPQQNLWGWVAGLGLSYDFNKWLSAFTEYNYRTYGRFSNPTLTNIAPRLNVGAGQRDALSSHATLNGSFVYLGLNARFEV